MKLLYCLLAYYFFQFTSSVIGEEDKITFGSNDQWGVSSGLAGDKNFVEICYFGKKIIKIQNNYLTGSVGNLLNKKQNKILLCFENVYRVFSLSEENGQHKIAVIYEFILNNDFHFSRWIDNETISFSWESSNDLEPEFNSFEFNFKNGWQTEKKIGIEILQIIPTVEQIIK